MLARTPNLADARTTTAARIMAPPVRRVAIVIDPGSARTAHGAIAQRLRQAGIEVSFAPAPQGEALPASGEQVVELARPGSRLDRRGGGQAEARKF